VIPLAVHGVVTDQRFDVDYYAGGPPRGSCGATGERHPGGDLPHDLLAQRGKTPATSDRGAPRADDAVLGDDEGVACFRRGCRSPRCIAVPRRALRVFRWRSLTLSTNVLSNGHVWLLPTWTYSAIRYANDEVNSVAVSPKYLHYRRATFGTGLEAKAVARPRGRAHETALCQCSATRGSGRCRGR